MPRRDGIELNIVRLPGAKKGFVLLPRRWVVERSLGWVARFRRLARDYERLTETLEGYHFVVFATRTAFLSKPDHRIMASPNSGDRVARRA